MIPKLKRLTNLWATRSLLVGAIATVIDLSCVIALVELAGWPRVPSAMLGVTVGSTIGFLLNKYFAFRDHDRNVGPQAARYAVATAGAILLHGGFMFVLTNLIGIHYVLSKFIADLVVFSGGHLLAMRFLVFPRAAKVLAQTVEGAGNAEEESLAA